MACLKTPLFINENLNRENKRMRAVHLKDVTNGDITYSLWRKDCKPERSYASWTDDQYYLWVLVNDRLIPLNLTEHFIRERVGFNRMTKEKYGNIGERDKYFDSVRKSFPNPYCQECNDKISALLTEEERVIKMYGSGDEVLADFISDFLSSHAKGFERQWEEYCTTGEIRYPDAVGAFLCGKMEEYDILKEAKHAEAAKQNKERIEAERREHEEKVTKTNAEFSLQIAQALKIFSDGGRIMNSDLKYYENDNLVEEKMIAYLMKKFGIKIPGKTLGWIREKLNFVVVKDRKFDSLNYMKTKNSKCSDSVFTYLHKLQDAICEEV